MKYTIQSLLRVLLFGMNVNLMTLFNIITQCMLKVGWTPLFVSRIVLIVMKFGGWKCTVASCELLFLSRNTTGRPKLKCEHMCLFQRLLDTKERVNREGWSDVSGRSYCLLSNLYNSKYLRNEQLTTFPILY